MTKASLKMVVFMMEISFERINISTECRTLLDFSVSWLWIFITFFMIGLMHICQGRSKLGIFGKI